MSDDWRIYLVTVIFGLYLGWLGGTRRDDDRRDAIVSLAVAFVVGVGFVLFGSGEHGAVLAATSLLVGPVVAIAAIIGFARVRA
ncbi:MAG: hypothetical protein OEQ47_17230 [Acidimicrobiia bacterium]|nr:hypothetical protein [Acidimicrobiia bacterium]